MPTDPITRLEVCRREIDRVFGDGHASANPQLVAAVLTAATIDQAAMTIASALLVEEEPSRRPESVGIVRAGALLR
jgi:hypothetical protein